MTKDIVTLEKYGVQLKVKRMKRIVLDVFVMGFVGGLVGGGIKFFQWIGADLTFGLLVTMPTADSILPMILKATVVGMILGLIIGIYELITGQGQRELSGSYSSRKVHYNQEDRNEFIDIGEYKQKEEKIWKKEQYMDASGAWRMPDDDYIDASGAWRKPGEMYIDASGAWRRPGEEYIDESGVWRKPGEKYIDHSGAWKR